MDAAALSARIEALNPKGKTPITGAVLKAFEAVRAREEPTTIILVSDGLETCGGAPCKVVGEAKKNGVKFVMHVVGFDVGEGDVSQLECTAQAGGGLYFNAKNADELAAALDQTVAAPAELPAGLLSVTTMADGKLEDAIVTVYRAEDGEEVVGGRTYSRPETNPRTFELPPGKYRVQVGAVKLKDRPKKTIDVTVIAGQVMEKNVDFGTTNLLQNAVQKH